MSCQICSGFALAMDCPACGGEPEGDDRLDALEYSDNPADWARHTLETNHPEDLTLGELEEYATAHPELVAEYGLAPIIGGKRITQYADRLQVPADILAEAVDSMAHASGLDLADAGNQCLVLELVVQTLKQGVSSD